MNVIWPTRDGREIPIEQLSDTGLIEALCTMRLIERAHADACVAVLEQAAPSRIYPAAAYAELTRTHAGERLSEALVWIGILDNELRRRREAKGAAS